MAQETLTSPGGSLAVRHPAPASTAAWPPQLDVRRAETGVETARSDVANFTTIVAQAKNALDLLVGAGA